MASVSPTPSDQPVTVATKWLGFAVIRRHPNGKRRVHLRWFRLVVTLVGLTAVFWLLAALGLYFFFKLNRGFQDEQFADDLLLLFRYKEHDHKMGEYYIRTADTHMQNKPPRLAEALQDYRLGVLKAPENLHARQMLAEFYSIYYKDQQDTSLSVLEDGLPYALDNNPEYIIAYFQRLMQAHEPDHAIELCQKYLAQKLTNEKVRQAFALNLASVYVEQGDFDKGEDILQKYKLEDTYDGTILASELLWQRGQLHKATAYLEKALVRYPRNTYIYSLLARFYRDLADLDNARKYISLSMIAAPTDVAPRIEILGIYAKSGEKARLAHEEQSIIKDFGTDPNAMVQLADFAANQGDVTLTRQVNDLAIASKDPQFNLAAFSMLVCEAYLTNDDYDNALTYMDEIEKDNPHWLSSVRSVFESLRAVADYGVGRPDLTNMYLTALINSNTTRPDTIMSVANRFLSHGAFAQAKLLLKAAHQMDPFNQAILAQLVSADLQIGDSSDLSDNLQHLLKTRHPPLELMLDASRQLGSDRFLFVPDRETLLAKIDIYINNAVKDHEDDTEL